MSKFFRHNSVLIRNCIILHLLAACFASFLADFHKGYQDSARAHNIGKFSRIVSLSVAYQAKQNFTQGR